MKKIMFLWVVFFGLKTHAVEVGFYTCELIEQPANYEELPFLINVFADKIVFPDSEGGDEVYFITPQAGPMLEETMTQEEIESSLEYYRYKLYRQDKDVIKFQAESKDVGEEVEVVTSTLTKLSNYEFIISDIYKEDGVVVTSDSLCRKEEAMLSQLKSKKNWFL